MELSGVGENFVGRIAQLHFTLQVVILFYDHIITFLENTFMPVERTLLDAGETEAVRETRLAFQRAMEARFTKSVEDITGRKVRAFLSQVSLEPDISVEVFVLERTNAQHAPEGLA